MVTVGVDDGKEILFADISDARPVVEIIGTPGATGILHGKQVTGTDLNISKSFTLDSFGKFKETINKSDHLQISGSNL